MKELLIDDEIGGWVGLYPDEVTSFCDAVKPGEDITIKINSPGGDFFAMVPIFNAIRNLARKKENKIDFDVSKDLNNEIDNNKKFLEDPYKAILSQINFNANPASFLFAKDSDITDKKAEAFKYGVDSISFGEADNTEELENLFDLKQAASDIDNITTEKKIEYSNSANELVNPQNNEEHPLDNAKTLVMNEKDKYSLYGFNTIVCVPEQKNKRT